MMFTLSLTDFKYAQRARTIVNRAVINEDPNAKIIRGLFYEMWMVHLFLKLVIYGEGFFVT